MRAYFEQNWKAWWAVLWYMISRRALFLKISSTVRYVSHRNFSHGVTIARSVLSRDCSPETVDKRIDSGVSVASRSSMLVVEVVDSMPAWTSSALACASVTFCSASSMNFLKTVYGAPLAFAFEFSTRPA